MDDKRIQQVLDIEKQANEIHASAISKADQMPRQAEKEAEALIEKAKTEAEQEAQRIIAEAQNEGDPNRIQSEADEEVRRGEALAMTNFNRAVSYVIDRVVGRE